MFRKRTRLTSQVWTVIFLLLFNDALAQTTTESLSKISPEEPSKLVTRNRTVLRKLVEDSKTKISNDEKHDFIFTNSTNFQDKIERSLTHKTSKQKDLNGESINEEKIETGPVISTGKTFDSLDGTTLADSIAKSKLSKNNVSDKTWKLVPDEESLPKLPRNKSKAIFLEAFKEGARHNVEKSEIVTPEFIDDYEIEEQYIGHREATTQSATKRKESLENFDIEVSKKSGKHDDKEEGLSEDDSFSLANDTNVNFKQTKNETNLISENDDSIDLEFSPKNDAEIVQNITRSPIMRIVQAAEEKKGFVHNDKSFIDKKINIKPDNSKNFTKKLEGEIGDSANKVDLKSDEKVKIDISSKPLPSTKIEISANADIPLFKLDSSSSQIDITSKSDASSSKTDVISKTEISKDTPTKTDKASSKIDISPNSDDSFYKIDIHSPNTDDASSKTDSVSKDSSSKMDMVQSKSDDSSSKTDTLPSTSDVISTKLDISKVDATLLSKAESLSEITNSSLIDELPKKKETPKTKESIENLSDLTKTNDNVSPTPRARTISFSGINEFIPENVDSKIVTTKPSVIERPVTKRPFQLDKEVDVRPYPYLKTDIKETIDESENADKATGFGKKIEESTEEISAYENTIGRKGSDKKLVITEPSVVIENSIQQFKPTYFKRSGNSTKLNYTISDFGIRTTSKSIEDDNLSYVSSPSTVKIDFENKEITKQVTDNEQKIDLTENGITETNLQNVNITKTDVSSGITAEAVTEKSSEKTKDKSTEKPKMSETKSSFETLKNLETENTKKDVPSTAESSKLNFSQATESSTENSITKKQADRKIIFAQNATESSRLESTKEMTNTEPTNVSSTTQVLSLNKSEIHVNSVIPISIDSPETTTVEYEFVGLKETTVPGEENKNPEETTASVSANSHRPTDFKPATNSDKLTTSTESAKSMVSGQSADAVESTEFGKSDLDKTNSDETDSSKSGKTDSGKTTEPTISDKSSDSDRSINSEESTTTFSYILRDGTTETLSESNTQSSNEETTIIVSTEEIVTDVSEIAIKKFTTSEKTSEGRSTSEDKSTLQIETTKSDETTLIPSQEIISQTTVSYDGTTIIATVDHSSAGELLKRNTTPTVDSTDSKLTSETSIKTTVVQQFTTDTTPLWTSTSAPDPRIISVTSESTIVKSITKIPTASVPTPPPEDVRIFVRIVFEGTWSDVCPHLDSIREMIANLLTTGAEKIVSPRQVIFYQTQCTEGVLALTSLSSSETPLTSVLIYIVDEDGNFDEYMTKLLPDLYKVSMPTIDFPLPVRSFLLVQETDSGNAIAVVVISSVAFISLVLLAGLLFIMRKRQTRFNYGERCRPVSLDAYSLDSVSAYNSVRRKGAIRASKRSYGNPTFEDSSAIPSHPLNFAGLSSFCNDVNAISEEFAGIPQITAKIDELPQGAEVKNRYANVIPLPETRVPLQRLNNDLLTEYINASYVRGPKNATKYYIACQAPTESSVTDFWRMIWEQQSKVIIMLTDLVENGVEKCSEYIPPSEVTDCHRLYGDYQVTLKKRETKEKYAISTLHLKNLENNTFREVSHIWYLWPSNGMPDSASLIAVLLEARAFQRGGPGPIVVHCSPGTGRTGTLIALDLGIRQYEITRTVDVPRVVYTIRRDRAGAVQTKEQYAFIYKALNLYATKLSGGALEST